MSATMCRRDARVRDDGAAGSPRRVALVLVATVAALLLGGCRGDARAAAPVTAPTAAPGTVPARQASGADPLADVESAVDAVDREVDADAGAAGR